MFIDNKYTTWYYRIVGRARERSALNQYVERHHIVPLCAGGNDVAENMVDLTAREHFICHLLLTKMTAGNLRHKMLFALNMMLVRDIKRHDRYLPASKLFEYARRGNQLAQSQKRLSPETKQKIGNAHRGKILSATTKQKLRLAKTGKPGAKHTAETCLKISKSNTGKKHSTATKTLIGDLHRGKTISEEAKRKMVETNKQRYKSKIIVTLRSPDGEVFIQNEQQSAEAFCKSLGLQFQTINLAHQHNRKMRNGWTVVDITRTK